MYDVIIIGSGPAGLAAAAFTQGKVLVLEKKKDPAKKLLISGGGQGNLTSDLPLEEFFTHYGDAGTFVKPVLRGFTPTDLMDLCAQEGLPLLVREDRKVFPASGRSADIRDMLLRLSREKEVSFSYDDEATMIRRDGEAFLVRSKNEEYQCRNILLAAGGASYPGTGSDGSGFSLAQILGHRIVPPRPALAPVYVKEFRHAHLAGVVLQDQLLEIWRDGKKRATGTGDLLFTDRGLSGPAILDSSRYIEAGDEVRLILCPMERNECDGELQRMMQRDGKRNVLNLLSKFNFPRSVIKALLSDAETDDTAKAAELPAPTRKKIASLLTGWPFIVDAKGDFSVAMATTGGVWRDEINRKTMESKLVRGLYFAGEVMDVDGDTGGFNIQWAFSSGIAAARALGKSHKS